MNQKPPTNSFLSATTFVLFLGFSCGVEPSEPNVIGSESTSPDSAAAQDGDADGENSANSASSEDATAEKAQDKDFDSDLQPDDSDLSVGECQGKVVWGLRSETEKFVPLGANPLQLQQTSNQPFSFYLDRFREFSAAGQGAYHDAASYGVKVLPVSVRPGSWYWRAVGVHHLLANENRSKHHLFVEVLDAEGQQIRDPNLFAALYSSESGVEATSMRLDKPLNEPAGNQPMYKGSIIFVGMQRAGDLQNLPSERVVGIHSEHDDEPLPDGEIYNSFGHHSFYVVFQLTQVPKWELAVEGAGIDRKQVRLTNALGREVAAETGSSGVAVFKNLDEDSYNLSYLGYPQNPFPISFAANHKSKAVSLRLDSTDCP